MHSKRAFPAQRPPDQMMPKMRDAPEEANRCSTIWRQITAMLSAKLVDNIGFPLSDVDKLLQRDILTAC